MIVWTIRALIGMLKQENIGLTITLGAIIGIPIIIIFSIGMMAEYGVGEILLTVILPIAVVGAIIVLLIGLMDRKK